MTLRTSDDVDGPKGRLPLSYPEIIRTLNFSPAAELIATVEHHAVRIDIFRTSHSIIVMPRPTDWNDFRSSSANICLAKNSSIQTAITLVSNRITELRQGSDRDLALVGFSQGGFIAIKLVAALLPLHGKAGPLSSITTFNSAPLCDLDDIGLSPITTNYRTVLAGTPANLLGYRVGDYVTLLGPMVGKTYEVEVQDIGPSLPQTKLESLSYGALHADPYLLADNASTWRLKDISRSAMANPGLRISHSLHSACDMSCESPAELTMLIGRAMIDDAQFGERKLDPCVAAQFENFAGFSAYKRNSKLWKWAGQAAASAAAHRRAGQLLRIAERTVGPILVAAGKAANFAQRPRRS
jgi:hypothetical protein